MGFFRCIYKKIYGFNQFERDAWIRIEAKKISPGSVVLDLGAGSCPYRSFFSHCDYRTQDFMSLEDEQLLGRSGYGKIDYVCDATSIPVKDASFDVILSTETLEHVPEPIKVLCEIARILAPGGTLLMTAPLGSGLHQHPYHFYGGYTPFFYRKFLGELGFRDVEVVGNGNFFKLFSQESIRCVSLSKPWALKCNRFFRLLWFPCWLLFSFGMFALAPAFHLLDRFDTVQDFTVGYHVRAIKGAVSPSDPSFREAYADARRI